DARPLELIGRQQRTLIAWSGFIDPDMYCNTALVCPINRRKRRAVPHGGEGAGITVGQDVDRSGVIGPGAYEFKSVLADGQVAGHVLIADACRAAISGGYARGAALGLCARSHSLQGPAQVDGRRPRL